MGDEEIRIKIKERTLPVKKRYVFTFLTVIAIICGGYYIYNMLGMTCLVISLLMTLM